MDEGELLAGTCHCGAVKLWIPEVPATATRCNCSLCRRLASTWAYFALGTVRFEGHPEHTEAYVQGDRTLRNLRCKTCGCATHWEPIDPIETPRLGVNLNNFPPALLDRVTIRRFDGADTWTYME